MWRFSSLCLAWAALLVLPMELRAGDAPEGADAAAADLAARRAAMDGLAAQLKTAGPAQRAVLLESLRVKQQAVQEAIAEFQAQVAAAPGPTLAQRNRAIPAEAPAALKSALRARNALSAAFEEFQSSSASLAPEPRSQALAQWVAQHAEQIAAARGVAQAAGAGPALAPADLGARLQAQQDLASAFRQFEEDHRDDAPETRSQALTQWVEAHRAAIAAAPAAVPAGEEAAQ